MAGATLLEVVLPFARNVALARIIAPDQFGIATTLVVTMAIVEMVCDLGLPQSIVRGSRVVRGKIFLRTIHTLNLLRYATAASLMLVFTYLELKLFGVTTITTYWLVVSVFLLRGLENLGQKRLTRRYQFGREAALAGGFQIAWTTGAIAAAVITKNHDSLLWGMLIGTAWVVLASHALSVSRWRLGWNRKAVVEACSFGLPLIPNGAASALTVADRIVVGGLLGARSVALYSVIMGIILVPRSVILRLSTTALAPHFANLQGSADRFQSTYRMWITGLSFVSLSYGLVIAVFGAPFIRLVFGDVYDPSRLMMSLAALNVYLKLLMLAPLPAAYALGQTKFVLVGSIVAAVAVMPSFAVFSLVPGTLEAFLALLTLFEAVGLAWFLERTCRVHGLGRKFIVAAVGFPVTCLLTFIVAAIAEPTIPPRSWFAIGSIVGVVATALYAGIALLSVLRSAQLRVVFRRD